MDRGFSARLTLKKFYLMSPSRIVGSVHGPSAHANGTPLYAAIPSGVTEKSMLTVSKIFFLGLSVGSASPTKPSQETRAPLAAPAGGATGW